MNDASARSLFRSLRPSRSANWPDVVKAHSRAIFTAARHAQRAAAFSSGLQPAASAG